MSFSFDTKKELCRRKIDSKIEALLELSALSRMNAAVRFRGSQVSISFSSENREVIARVTDLARALYGAELSISSRKNAQLRQAPLYSTVLSGEVVDRFLSQSALNEFGAYTQPKERIFGRLQSQENGCAFLRGAFLGGGSIVDPSKSYHLEIVTPHVQDVWLLHRILEKNGIRASEMERKGVCVVYIKDSEAIADFLVAIGATGAMLRLEDVKAMKDLRNDINRRVNAETANMDKSISASFRQIEAIQVICRTIGIEQLPENLAELCYIRLKNPDSNLRELGAMLSPPIGKSGVNHRMQRILKIAEENSTERTTS